MNPLAAYPWSEVEKLNKSICEKGGYQHGPTSEGAEPAKLFYEEKAAQKRITPVELVETMRELHKKSPFLFMNGNTFTELGKNMLVWIHGQPSSAVRSAVGHHIAGTAILSHKELGKLFKARENER